MLRNIAAVVAGIFVGMVVNMSIIQLNTGVLFPLPAGADMNDAAQFNAYLASLPAIAFVVVMAAHLGQAFVGGLVAARLSASHPMRLALVVGVFALVGGVAALLMYDGPAWMVVELPLYLVVAWAGGRLGRRGVKPQAPESA
jgi:hypothetical protein